MFKFSLHGTISLVTLSLFFCDSQASDHNLYESDSLKIAKLYVSDIQEQFLEKSPQDTRSLIEFAEDKLRINGLEDPTTIATICRLLNQSLQEHKDSIYAFQVAQEEQKGKFTDLQREQEDSLLAQALAEMDLQEKCPRSGYNIPVVPTDATEEDIKNLNMVVQASRNIKMDSDVHGMTRTFARPYYQHIKSLEQKYLKISTASAPLTLEEVEQIINQLTQRRENIKTLIPAINVAITKMRGYWGSPVDNETGVNLQEALSNTFLVAQAYGDDALASLCFVLADNDLTGGGCHPGITGRLVQQYFIFVSAAFEHYHQ